MPKFHTDLSPSVLQVSGLKRLIIHTRSVEVNGELGGGSAVAVVSHCVCHLWLKLSVLISQCGRSCLKGPATNTLSTLTPFFPLPPADGYLSSGQFADHRVISHLCVTV